MNALDRAIGWFSPTAGLRRARARAAMSMVRAYDGAKKGRLNGGGWSLVGSSANAHVASGRSRLAENARDLVRNNPYAARIVDVMVCNLVGAGIVPQSRTGDPALDKKVDDLWKWFVEGSDSQGLTDLYGQQSQAVRSMVEGGEALARFRGRRPADGLKVPLQLQLMEPDHIDEGRASERPQGGAIIQGIEFDALDRRQAYYLFPEHPGDTMQPLRAGAESQRIPASEVIHLYRPLRIGQVRGVSWLSPIMSMARNHDDLLESVLVKMRVEACFGALITSSGDASFGSQAKAADGRVTEELAPGMLARLQPGETVQFANPTNNTAYEPIALATLMAMAVGVGATYDQVSGDLRQANYSSLRAGKIEQRRLIEQIQWHCIIPMKCAPVWRRFIQTCSVAGLLPDHPSGFPATWMPPRNEPIDPLKELLADIEAVRAGAMTPQQFIARWGYDWRTQLGDIAEFNAMADDLGLALSIDARRLNGSGSLQATDLMKAEAANKQGSE